MLITILDGGWTFEYYVNPRNIIGVFRDKVTDGYYIDTVDGHQYQVAKESYTRIVAWILDDAERSR